jgi:hypothetical protein
MAEVPYLVGILLCDQVVVDQGTLKKTVVGIHDRLFALQLPTARPCGLYARFADLGGDYRLLIRVVRLAGQSEELIMAMEGDVKAPNPLVHTELALNLPVIQYPQLGKYEFQVFLNDIFMGRAVLTVERMEVVPHGSSS